MTESGRITRRILRKLRGPRKSAMNFSTRHDLDSRWQLIAPRLSATPGWYLDIGTNNGDTLRRLSGLGHWGLGLEVSRESAPAAVPDNSAVMIANVTSSMLRSAPSFDGVFMLSVFHRIWAIQGPAEARATLSAAAGCGRLLFFEGSTRHDRWRDLGQQPPEFPDMNAAESIAWHESLLSRARDGVAVEFLGVTHSLKTREPRPLFAVTR